jgi:hypothetical protein
LSDQHLRKTSYCGLYCGDCSFGKGTIPDLARDLRKELRDARFDKVAEIIPFKEFQEYPQCYAVLGAMVKLRCKGCRGGSRSRFCEVAQCALKKELEGCWECADFPECRKLEFLEHVHGDAHLKNLRKIKKVGVVEWADEGPRHWYAAKKK